MSNLTQQSQNPEMAFKIKNDLVDYFRFIDLIQKNRSEEEQQEIDAYVKSEKNVLKRITFIEELDKREKTTPHVAVEVIDSKDRKVRKKKLPQFTVTPFFNYLLNTRKSIKQFGEKNHVLTSRFFSLKLSNDSEAYYKKILEKTNTFALPAVSYILKHGWEKLDKKAYSVISVFSDFLKYFSLNGNILAFQQPKKIISKLEPFIQPYLKITSSIHNLDILKDSLYKILYPIPSFNNQLQDIMGYISEIFQTNAKGLYFHNIILAVYMLYYRRAIKAKDLIDYYSVRDIADITYDYDSTVLQNIKNRLNDLEGKHKEAEREVFFLKFLEENLDVNTENKPLIALISNVYHHQENYRKQDNLDTENSFLVNLLDGDITLTFIQFTRGFLSLYDNFLKGRLVLKNSQSITKPFNIFNEFLFFDERSKLNETVSELHTMKSLAPYLSVTLETFSQYFYSGKTDTQKEIKFCAILKKMIDTFYALGDKAITILYNNHNTKNLSGSEKLEAVKRQEIPLDKTDNVARVLPYAMFKISEDPNLTDKMVIDVLGEIAIFCINFCHLFKYQPITIRLIKKKKFIEITEEYYRIKSKMREFQSKMQRTD